MEGWDRGERRRRRGVRVGWGGVLYRRMADENSNLDVLLSTASILVQTSTYLMTAATADDGDCIRPARLVSRPNLKLFVSRGPG